MVTMEFKQRNLMQIADIICGNSKEGEARFFRYRSSSYLTEFFQDCDTDYAHDGSTRHLWVAATLRETANPSPLTRPIPIAAMTTRSKIWRRMSLSRNRFNRFSENVEWWGIASLRSSRQNHLYARWSFTSSHSFLSERMPKQ